jgi:hypothetical protein
MHVFAWSREDLRESFELALPPQQLERLLEAMKEHAQTEHVIGWNLQPRRTTNAPRSSLAPGPTSSSFRPGMMIGDSNRQAPRLARGDRVSDRA